MTAFDNPPRLDTDLVMGHIYQGQADLKILVDWLARESQPDLPEGLLLVLAMLHTRLNLLTPSHARH
jgi:hypothetical protein